MTGRQRPCSKRQTSSSCVNFRQSATWRGFSLGLTALRPPFDGPASTLSQLLAKLSAPRLSRSLYALARLRPTAFAAAATDPVLYSAARNAHCTSALQPSLRPRSFTGVKAGGRERVEQGLGRDRAGMDPTKPQTMPCRKALSPPPDRALVQKVASKALTLASARNPRS